MSIQELVAKQRTYFASGVTKDPQFRVAMLKKLKIAINAHQTQILEALKLDLNKSAGETFMAEIGVVLSELSYFIAHTLSFSKKRHKPTPFVLFKATSYIYPEPFGVCLIMSPWNYPFQLAMEPLIGCLAAGNTAIVKPASYAPATSQLIAHMLGEIYPEDYVATVLGGREANTQLLDQRFDFIFFTGSTNVGRTVMEKASKNLTPIALELGGKSPCIVNDVHDMRLAARRIAFGKFLNAGQSCVAPDYVLCKTELKGELIRNLQIAIDEFFGDHPLENPDLPKIITAHHHERLRGLMLGCEAVIGGDYNETQIAPTVLDHVTLDSPVMKEEIFGPILPILCYDNLEEAFRIIAGIERPLSLYLFT